MGKDREVSLREVTADNWEKVVDLELEEDQEDHLADNSYSLAESKFNPLAVPIAIYAGKKVVGFAMYESLAEEGEPDTYSIYRFMVDKKHQGKGYGGAALSLILDKIRATPNWRRTTICYVTENKTAKKFYANFGFKEIGLDEDGEMVAEICAPPGS